MLRRMDAPRDGWSAGQLALESADQRTAGQLNSDQAEPPKLNS